jgi:hypothetical protein
MDKDDILAAIRRTTQANGGSPLGRERFESITGIRRSASPLRRLPEKRRMV